MKTFANSHLCLSLKMQTFFSTMDVKPVSLYIIFFIFLLYSTLPTFCNPLKKLYKNTFLPVKHISVSPWKHSVHYMFILSKVFLLSKNNLTYVMFHQNLLCFFVSSWSRLVDAVQTCCRLSRAIFQLAVWKCPSSSVNSK